MTAPTSFGTPDRIITQAMLDAGLLQEGGTPSSEQYAKYMNQLNDLVNLLQTKGIKLWTLISQSVNLVSGQSTYTLSPTGDVVMTKPMRIIEASYVDSNNTSRTLNPMSWDEYSRLSRKTDTGSINAYFADKGQSSVVLSLWMVPDSTAATGTISLTLQQQITNVVSLTDTMNFPVEWYIALHWGLADEICTGRPQAIVDRCAARAKMYLEALEGWDVEDASTNFQPDQRGPSAASRFR